MCVGDGCGVWVWGLFLGGGFVAKKCMHVWVAAVWQRMHACSFLWGRRCVFSRPSIVFRGLVCIVC